MDPTPTSPQSKSRRRVQRAQYAAAGGSLQLPSLPRFHPAAYGSNSSSMTTTPNSTSVSPGALSPRAQQARAAAASVDPTQRHLAYYHQTILQQYMAQGSGSVAAQAAASGGKTKPPSPKLMPLAGSPGAVTPLELEGENYLAAGSAHQERMAIEALMREEAQRRGELSPRRQATA